MFSIARRRFCKCLKALVTASFCHVDHLERDKIPPHPRPVRGLDVLVEVVEDDVVDVLVPGQDLGDLGDLALPHLHPDDY